jgi:hypothetical protein
VERPCEYGNEPSGSISASMYREIMLRNKSIFQISTLICLSSISICNLLIDLPSYNCDIEPVSRQRIVKHIPAATNTSTTLELPLKTVFHTRSMQSGYKENSWVCLLGDLL